MDLFTCRVAREGHLRGQGRQTRRVGSVGGAHTHKLDLRQAGDALARGIFGVPTVELGGRLYRGLDALDMVAAALRSDPWFDGPASADAGAPRPGVVRR